MLVENSNSAYCITVSQILSYITCFNGIARTTTTSHAMILELDRPEDDDSLCVEQLRIFVVQMRKVTLAYADAKEYG